MHGEKTTSNVLEKDRFRGDVKIDFKSQDFCTHLHSTHTINPQLCLLIDKLWGIPGDPLGERIKLMMSLV